MTLQFSQIRLTELRTFMGHLGAGGVGTGSGRGVYQPDSFSRVAKYGITTLVTTDEGLKKYLDNVIQQLKGNGGAAISIVFHASERSRPTYE